MSKIKFPLSLSNHTLFIFISSHILLVSQENKKIALITTKWNPEFVTPCVEWCRDTLIKKWISQDNIEIITVPGWVEIPLVAKKLATSWNYAAIVAIAFICENPIYHFHFVADSVVKSIIQVGLETQIPVLSAVLSPTTFDRENKKDTDFYAQHMRTKWIESAESTLEIISLHHQI